jgi:hypothetical protein
MPQTFGMMGDLVADHQSRLRAEAQSHGRGRPDSRWSTACRRASHRFTSAIAAARGQTLRITEDLGSVASPAARPTSAD